MLLTVTPGCPYVPASECGPRRGCHGRPRHFRCPRLRRGVTCVRNRLPEHELDTRNHDNEFVVKTGEHLIRRRRPRGAIFAGFAGAGSTESHNLELAPLGPANSVTYRGVPVAVLVAYGAHGRVGTSCVALRAENRIMLSTQGELREQE